MSYFSCVVELSNMLLSEIFGITFEVPDYDASTDEKISSSYLPEPKATTLSLDRGSSLSSEIYTSGSRDVTFACMPCVF